MKHCQLPIADCRLMRCWNSEARENDGTRKSIRQLEIGNRKSTMI